MYNLNCLSLFMHVYLKRLFLAMLYIKNEYRQSYSRGTFDQTGLIVLAKISETWYTSAELDKMRNLGLKIFHRQEKLWQPLIYVDS